MSEPPTIVDRVAAVVQILYAILALAVLGLAYQYSTTPVRPAPDAVRGSLLGPDQAG